MGTKIGQIELEMLLNDTQYQKTLANVQRSAVRTSEKMSASFKEAGAEINSNFKKSMSSVQQSAGAAGEKMSAAFKKAGAAIGAAFSVAAVIKFGKESVESAANVQAANSQLEQTFGSLKDSATDAIKQVADESGILETRLQGVGTSIYAFAKTSGMDSASALGMMKEALQATADSAAYYDRSLEDTAESLKSFLKGNYANDAALGISCTETTRNTAANKLYGKSFKDLSEAQKQLTLLQMVKDANAASGALGQAARESDGWENVLGNLKESWNQLLAVVGKPILQGAVTVIKSITTAIQTLTEYAQSAVKALSDLFGWEWAGAESAASVAQSAGETAQAIDESADSQEELAKQTKKTSEAAKNGVASFDRLNVITQNKGSSEDDSGSASSSEASSGGSGSAAASTAQKKAESVAEGISKAFRKVFKNLYESSGLKNFVDNVQKGIDKVDWSSIRDNCKSIFNSLKPIAATAFNNLKKVGNSAFGALGSAVGAFVTIGGKSIQTVTGGVAKWLDKDKTKIQRFINIIGGNFSKGFDNIGKSFDSLGTIIGDSIDRMRPRMEESISNLLSGLTDFAGGVGELVSGAFETATGSIAEWLEKDGDTIGAFFDNLQTMGADVFDTIGMIFGGIGETISDWWNGEHGQPVFKAVCDMFNNIGTTLMNVWNKWIMPIWDAVCSVVQTAWNNFLQPVFSKILEFFGALWGLISYVWNTWLSPIVNWLINVLAPVFKNIWNSIKSIFETVFTAIGGFLSGFWDALTNLIDFIKNVFSGKWEEAWENIKGFFGGIWSGILSLFRGVINLIIDAVNFLWTGIYDFFKNIANTLGGAIKWVGELFGQDDWGWELPNEPPLIPKLKDENPSFAKGGIVKAPTLAVVGDNPGAGSGDPEVISPLSKLQNMIGQSNGQDVVILTQILDYLKRLYEMFVIYKNSGGNKREFFYLPDYSELFEKIREQNDIYKDTHNGVSAFA